MPAGIKEGNYQRLPVPFPLVGKNTTIAPHKLPMNYASAMVNIVPGQSGLGEVRNGTLDVYANQALPTDASILKHFSYTWAGVQHRICYGYEYTLETLTVSWVAKNQVSFTAGGSTPTYYEDMPIRITYTASGGNQRTIYAIVTGVSGSGTITLTFNGDELPASSVTVNSLYYGQGKVWKANEDGSYTVLKSGLRAAVIPCGVQADDGKLVIVNGHDNNMSYDGSAIETLYGWAKDQGISPAWVNQTTVKIQTGTVIAATNYQPIGSDARRAQVEMSTQTAGLSISSITLSAGIATYTTTVATNLPVGAYVEVTGSARTEFNIKGNVVASTATTFQLAVTGTPANEASSSAKLHFSNLLVTGTVNAAYLSNMDTIIEFTANKFPAAVVDIVAIYYEARPPILRYIAKAHERLWGLAGSVPRADKFQNGTDATRVYFTAEPNTSKTWYKSTTSALQYVDTAGEQLQSDNVEAIIGINGGMAFVGRSETQIWVGVDPTIADSADPSVFKWDKTIPIGTAHPSLITDLPNDAAIMTPSGVRTLSSINQTQQFSVQDDVGAAVSTETSKEVSALKNERWAYLRACAFTYPRGRFIGFKMGRTTHAYLINYFGKSWGELVGDFGDADWIGADNFNNTLILSLKGKLLRYADGGGNQNTVAWGDRNDTETVSWYWFTPWLRTNETARWANQRVELDIDPGAAAGVEMLVLLDGDGRKEKKVSVTTPSRVDTYYTPTSRKFAPPTKRLRFLAKNFMLGTRGQTKVGPIKLNGINLYGRQER